MHTITETPDSTTLFIQTDGSCRHKPRRGGFAYRFIYIDEHGQLKIEDFLEQGFQAATVNEMELYACVASLEKAWRLKVRSSLRKIFIFTDSQYVAGFYRMAIHTWSKSQWLKSDKTPVANAKVWKDLVRLTGRFYSERIFIEIQWEKGKTNEHNKAVDKMAKKSSQLPRNKQFSPSKARRKKFKDAGTFTRSQVSGQTLSIRVVTERHHSIQKFCEHKCEIITRGHLLYKCLGSLFVPLPISLKVGHHYLVKLADNQTAQIEEILREHKKRKPKDATPST